MPALWARALFLAALCSISSCSFFSRQPPLPRRAAVEHSENEEKFAKLIQDADIVYFPSESAVFRSRSEAAWKLLDALRRGGGSFAIGWDETGTTTASREYLKEAGGYGATILMLNDARRPAESEGAAADQHVAEQIAGHYREHQDNKVLIFLRREWLGVDHGVPYLVAQKTKARQLILNPQRHREANTRLLARK